MNSDAADQAVSISLKSMQAVAETALHAGKGMAEAAFRHIQSKNRKKELLLERNLTAILKDEKNFLAFSMPKEQFSVFTREAGGAFPFASFTDRGHPGTVLVLFKKEDRTLASDSFRSSLKFSERNDDTEKKDSASVHEGKLLSFYAKDRSREETAPAGFSTPFTKTAHSLAELRTEAKNSILSQKKRRAGKTKNRPDEFGR